jgi:hypothetical protein
LTQEVTVKPFTVYWPSERARRIASLSDELILQVINILPCADIKSHISRDAGLANFHLRFTVLFSQKLKIILKIPCLL